jgi:tetratricopeptide (TPR) repeat protein
VSTAWRSKRGEERDLVLQAMAEIHLLMRHPKDALAIYDDLLLRQSSSPKLWNERGVSLHQDGRFTDAEESYRRALDSESGYATARNNLGVSLYHRGAAEEASEAFREAIEAEPTFSKARLNLALLLTAAKAITARARRVPSCARPRARESGRVERHRPCARRAAEIRGGAERIRAVDSIEAGVRGSALQHELHALEPR